jgi:hypothetical protein
MTFSGLDEPWGPPGPGTYNGVTFTSGRVYKIKSSLPLKWGYSSGSTRIDSHSSTPRITIAGPLASCAALDGSGSDAVANYDTPAASGLIYDAASRTWQDNIKLTSPAFVADRCYTIQISDPVTGVTSTEFPIKTRK